MPNLNVQFSGALQSYDQSAGGNVNFVNRAIALALAGTVQYYDAFAQIPSTGVAITLPAATVYVVLVWNKSTTTQNLTLIYSPTGTRVIGPGDIDIYFCPSKAAGIGITAVNLTSSSGTCPAEIFMAA